MKNIIILLLLASISFIGCQEENGVLAPDNGQDGINTDKLEFISLPNSEGFGVEEVFTTGRFINHNVGGELYINESYQGGIYGRVKIDARLEFHDGVLPVNTFITMTVDDEFTAITFTPHMTFNGEATLDLKFEGLDLVRCNLTAINFIYLGEDGLIEQIHYDELIVDLTIGKLEVKNAKLPHFSRFGFTR